MRPVAVEQDLARVGDVGPGEALDERRLAGAVVADDREDLAGVEVDVDAVEADDPAEGDDQLAAERTGSLRRGLRAPCRRGDAAVGDFASLDASCLHLPDPLVDRDGDDDEDAGGEDPPLLVDPSRDSPKLNVWTISAPMSGADQPAAATEQAGAADDDGGDARRGWRRGSRWAWPRRPGR